MSERKTSKLTVADMRGRQRMYEFVLLDTETGLRFVYRYLGLFAMAKSVWQEHIIPIVMAIAGRWSKEEGDDDAGSAILEEFKKHGVDSIADAIALMPMIFSEDRVMEFGKAVLAGATIDGEKVDENGMCELFAGDPLEHITAIFWATTANYPKYLNPILALFTGETESEEDSSPEQKVSALK